MTPAQATKLIFARWISKWTDAVADAVADAISKKAVPSSYTLAAPAYSFDNDAKPQAEYYARVGLVSGPRVQQTMGAHGNRKFQQTGWIRVKLNSPPNAGRAPVDILTHASQLVYEAVRFGESVRDNGIVTHAGTPSELSNDVQAPQLWIVTVLTPFEYYETK